MCIAIPGVVLESKGATAKVDFFGKVAEVDAAFVKVKPNDYVLAFSGKVIEKISRYKAEDLARILGGVVGNSRD